MRKAMTERVVYQDSSRENGILVEAVYEDGRRKPFLSCNAQLVIISNSKHYRRPALKDRI